MDISIVNIRGNKFLFDASSFILIGELRNGRHSNRNYEIHLYGRSSSVIEIDIYDVLGGDWENRIIHSNPVPGISAESWNIIVTKLGGGH